ncbi:hypothetical protein ACEQPO_13085 [Bacillus sp. SL00103]
MSVQVDRFPYHFNQMNSRYLDNLTKKTSKEQSKGHHFQNPDEQEAEFQDVLDALVGSDERGGNLMATVDATNRTVAQTDTSSKAEKKTDTLGKDQFLKILLCLDFKTRSNKPTR